MWWRVAVARLGGRADARCSVITHAAAARPERRARTTRIAASPPSAGCLDRLRPPLWLHGHTALVRRGLDSRCLWHGGTLLYNCTGATLVELVPPGSDDDARPDPNAGRRSGDGVGGILALIGLLALLLLASPGPRSTRSRRHVAIEPRGGDVSELGGGPIVLPVLLAGSHGLLGEARQPNGVAVTLSSPSSPGPRWRCSTPAHQWTRVH